MKYVKYVAHVRPIVSNVNVNESKIGRRSNSILTIGYNY